MGRRTKTWGALVATAAIFAVADAQSASAGGFTCTSSITRQQATAVMGVHAVLVPGGGGVDDCGVEARGYQHIILTGYVVRRSFFDRLRRTTRTRTHGSSETVQRTLTGMGGPAFSVQSTTRTPGATSPSITRSVFVYRHGRMLRPTVATLGTGWLASLSQLVRLARIAARRI